VDARKGKRKGEGKNNYWQITETKWRTILQQKWKDYFDIHNRAFLAYKFPCPHGECQYNLSCHDQDGLDHHYRTIHKCPVISADIKI
jgi:hypothetical protein